MSIRIASSGHTVGVAVHGVSLATVPKGAVLAMIEDALEKGGVLVCPKQFTVTPGQQIDFSLTFGPLDVTDEARALLPEHPEIFVVGNTGEQPVTFSPRDENSELEWHTDHIHLAVPARASLLLAKAVPPKGGDTLFACMYSAYDALSPDQQALCDSLEIVNDVSGLLTYLDDQGGDTVSRRNRLQSPVIWPLVRAHPRTGRKALYFGNQVSVGIVGWTDTKSKTFISELTEHSCAPAFQYRHRWQVGDAVLWDNRRVLHAGTPYDLTGAPREMHRTTIRETEPISRVRT